MVLYQTQGQYHSAVNLETYKQNRILTETFPNNCSVKSSTTTMKNGLKLGKSECLVFPLNPLIYTSL